MTSRRNIQETPVERLARFETEISANDDLAFGIELYSQALCLVRSDDPIAVDSIRGLYGEVIEAARQISRDAAALLGAARKDHKRLEDVEVAVFSPCPGHPDPEPLQQRAALMLKHYHRLFKERPRTDVLSHAELLSLTEAAAADPACEG